MSAALLGLALLAPLAAAAPGTLTAAPPERLSARVVSWDIGYRPPRIEDWEGRLASEVARSLEEGADVLVFPELIGWGLAPYRTDKSEPPARFITRRWNDELLPRLSRLLAGKDALVVLGSYPHQEAGWQHAFNRATVWSGGAWRFADKLDPTQPELAEDPPIRPGTALPLFPFRGGTAAALICFSVEMPEVAARLKAEGVHLLLVPSATSDTRGVGRILRTASARAVELGAAVLVAPLTGSQDDWKNRGSAALFLPDQEALPPGRVAPDRSSGIHRADFTIPWASLLGLRVQPAKAETRPFLAPSPSFTITR